MLITLSHWVTKTINNGELILYHWYSNNSVEIFDQNHPIYAFISENKILIEYESLSEEHKSDIDWLLEENFILKSDVIHTTKNIQNNTSNTDTLQLILLPAGEACNLACVYCYEDHLDRKSMHLLHQKALINFIKSQNKPILSIEYFGGEPTLNLKFIYQFSALLNENGIKFSASMTTNGTFITEDVLHKLYQANVKSFQITLDGYRELHNQLRPSKNGSFDSYQRVTEALKVIANSHYSDINVTLRLNVNSNTISEDNFDKFTQTIEQLIPKQDNRFFILPKIISDYSSANLLENEKARETYCKTRDSANQVTQKFEAYIDENYQSASALLLAKRGGYSCYANNPNSFVITPDLKVRKCTVALNDPINFVGYLTEEGLLRKTIHFDLWTKDYSDGYCKSCFLNKSCQGNSCPLANIKQNKKICPPIKYQADILTNKMINFYRRVN